MQARLQDLHWVDLQASQPQYHETRTDWKAPLEPVLDSPDT